MSQIAARSTPFITSQSGTRVTIQNVAQDFSASYYRIQFSEGINRTEGVGAGRDEQIDANTGVGEVQTGGEDVWIGGGQITVENLSESHAALHVTTDAGGLTQIQPGGTETIGGGSGAISPIIIGLVSLGGVVAAAALLAFLG